MNTIGQQLLLDVWQDEALTQNIVENVFEYIRDRFTVVCESAHEFNPQGLTHVMVLAESHFVIHTYPEHSYASVDLYMCKSEIDLNLVKKDLLAIFRPQSYRHHILRRGDHNHPSVAPAETSLRSRRLLKESGAAS